MNHRPSNAALLYRSAIVLAVIVALFIQLGIYRGRCEVACLTYFTDWGAILAGCYFAGSIVHSVRARSASSVFQSDQSRLWHPAIKFVATVGTLITMLVAHFMLGGGIGIDSGDPGIVIPLVLLHYVVPLLTLGDWLLFDVKALMKPTFPLFAALFPLLYFAYMLISVNVLNLPVGTTEGSRYPYPFMDVDVLGIGPVLGIAAGLACLFVAVGFALFGIDRLLGRKENP